MPDQDGGDGQEREGEPGSPPLRGEGGANAAAESENEKRAAHKEERQRARVTRGWSLFFQGAVAVATLVYVVSSYLLWLETREAVDLTRQSVEATAEMMGLTIAALDEARRSNDLAAEALEINRSQGEEALRLTRKSNELTKGGLDLSRRVFEVGERPWVTVAWFEPIELDLSAGAEPVIRAALLNTGRTPALNGQGRMTASISPVALPGDLPPADLTSIAVIGAGIQQSLRMKLNPIQEEDALALSTGKKLLVVFGYFAYDDLFGESHELSFCSWYRREDLAWAACPTGTSAN